MKLPSWLRRKAPETKLAYTVEIVTGLTVPDLPAVDLPRCAAEVLARHPETLAVDADTLARLATKSYIKVAEYPAGMDRETVQMLISRVRRWADWPNERSGMKRSKGYFPGRQIYYNPNTACAGALALRDRIIPVEDVQRLPLEGCWSKHCQCRWRLVKRDGTVA